jgi:predicted PolB exonuclease-like 3'-5' exonuclease
MSEKYLIMDIESFRNEAPWDPPAENPDAFPPLPCHGIAAIGGLMIEISDSKNRCSFLGTFGEIGDESTEYSRIEAFIKYFRKEHPILVTYNGRKFDILVIQLRAMRFGLPIPEFFRKNFSYRFSPEKSLDLCDAMGNFGSANIGTMAQISGVLGLPGKVDMDGTKVHALFRAGGYDKIHSYVQCDVIEEAIILLRYLHVRGELSAVAVNNLTNSIKVAAVERNDEMINNLLKLTDFTKLEVPYNILSAPKSTPEPASSSDDENADELAKQEKEDGIPF